MVKFSEELLDVAREPRGACSSADAGGVDAVAVIIIARGIRLRTTPPSSSSPASADGSTFVTPQAAAKPASDHGYREGDE